jgi:DNA polymerase III alpha subunit (gram-positive type)
MQYICVLDIEPSDDMKTIIQIAYEILDKYTLVSVYSANFLINEHNGKIDACKKIKLEDIQKYGLDVRSAFYTLRYNLSFCSHLVGHNISYDLSRISAYFKNLNMEFIEPIKVCTMKLSSKWCDLKNKIGGRKPPKLFELYICCFGSHPDMDKCHTANYDVEITIKCLRKLVSVGVISF